MAEVVVGVILTAAIGTLLVPAVKARIDRRQERFEVSSELLETLAASLWTYWKLIGLLGEGSPDTKAEPAVLLRGDAVDGNPLLDYEFSHYDK